MAGAASMREDGGSEMHAGFWREYMKEEEHLKHLRKDTKTSKWILQKYDERVWTRSVLAKLCTNTGLL